MRKNPQPVRAVWLCLCYVLLLFAALEGGLRIYDLFTEGPLAADLRVQLALNRSNDHPYLQYTSLKNFSGWMQFNEPGKLFWVETNSDGFRTHEFYPKREGVYRILLLGDSFIYGVNANQDETLGAKLEQALEERLKQDVEILSLGVSSYSCLRYAMLIKLYLDYLDPDMVVVAIDQSDFKEDNDRAGHYQFDRHGDPEILKNASELMSEKGQHRIYIDDEGNLIVEPRGRNWLVDLRVASALFNHTYRLAGMVRNMVMQYKANSINAKDYSAEIIEYDKLVARFGGDLSEVLPKRMQVDTIPLDLPAAIETYETALQSLRYIRRETASKDVELLLTSYPYPWMVSTKESLAYQLLGFGGIYDFRSNRVHPGLVEHFAQELGVEHLNAYPVFENQESRLYGDFDCHFNAHGYGIYADFLAASIDRLVRNGLKSK